MVDTYCSLILDLAEQLERKENAFASLPAFDPGQYSIL